MKALRYYGARDVRYEGMDDPDPQSTRDAVVKVEACSICGSDLHIYHGHGFSEDVGFCVGHEAVGEVVEVGSGVHRLKVGDKVMIPAAVGCGSCRACLAGAKDTGRRAPIGPDDPDGLDAKTRGPCRGCRGL
jgi:threonine dehydrogenase-like Zn-dependent dehydrogenase